MQIYLRVILDITTTPPTAFLSVYTKTHTNEDDKGLDSVLN